MRLLIAPCHNEFGEDPYRHLSAKCLPKDWWQNLVNRMMAPPGIEMIQLVSKDSEALANVNVHKGTLASIEELIKSVDGFVTIDSFLQHMVAKIRPEMIGVVVWTVSDPDIFGYPANYNVVNRQYLRADQYNIWPDAPYNFNAIPKAEDVLKGVEKLCQGAVTIEKTEPVTVSSGS